MAVGQMGLRPADFEQMTAAEFFYAWLGWSRREVEQQQQAWERERWSVWVLTSVQLDRKDRKPMQEMFPLPWDKEESAPPRELTIEERTERVKLIMQCIEK